MKKLLLKLSILPLFFLFTCTQEEVIERPFPRVRTISVTDITPSGVKFHGEIVYLNEEATEHGFFFSVMENPMPGNSEILNLGPAKSPGLFMADAKRSMVTGKRYYARAYVKSKDKTVLGEVLTFVSQGSEPSVIKRIEPASSTLGDTVEIYGENFSDLRGQVKVVFDQYEALVLATQDTMVKAIIPFEVANAKPNVSVSVNGDYGFPFPFSLAAPEVLTFSKTLIGPGDTLKLTGKNFLHRSLDLFVKINNEPCTQLSRKTNEVIIRVPYVRTEENEVSISLTISNLTTVHGNTIGYEPPSVSHISHDGEINYGDTLQIIGKHLAFEGLEIQYGGQIITPVMVRPDAIDFILLDEIPEYRFYVAFSRYHIDYDTTLQFASPIITAVRPAIATFDDEITISGKNFHTDPALIRLTVLGQPASVISLSDTSITARIPGTVGNCYSCNEISLYTAGFNVVERERFHLRAPTIDRFEPSEINDQPFVMEGKYFNKYNTDFNQLDFSVPRKSFKPTLATSDRLEFDLRGLNPRPYMSYTQNTTMRLSPIGEWIPVTINFLGPLAEKSTPNWIMSNSEMCANNDAIFVALEFHSGTYMTTYLPEDDTWSALKPVPARGTRPQIFFTMGNSVYAGIGLNKQNGGHFSDLWKYDDSTDDWEQLSDFPSSANSRLFSFVCGDAAYVGGGTIGFTRTREFWRFDGSQWQRGPDLPEIATVMKAFVFDDHSAYVFLDSHMYLFNAADQSWTFVRDLPQNTTFHTGTFIDGAGYFWCQSGFDQMVLKYDPNLDSWETLLLPVPYIFSHAANINGKQYVFRGDRPVMWEVDYRLYRP